MCSERLKTLWLNTFLYFQEGDGETEASWVGEQQEDRAGATQTEGDWKCYQLEGKKGDNWRGIWSNCK